MQIVVATRRVPQAMALVLGKVRNKVAARSGRNPDGPWPVARLALLEPLSVSRYCIRDSASPIEQQPYGAAATGN